jgi:hypothetical protein
LRKQKIGEVNLPDLLENFTAFHFFPRYQSPSAACPALTFRHEAFRRPDRFCAFRRETAYTYKTSQPLLGSQPGRYICYRMQQTDLYRLSTRKAKPYFGWGHVMSHETYIGPDTIL